MCILEDLHWARQPVLQLLDHVAQRSARSRLLLLCTHRTTAPDRSDDLTYAIADLYRLDGVRRLPPETPAVGRVPTARPPSGGGSVTLGDLAVRSTTRGATGSGSGSN